MALLRISTDPAELDVDMILRSATMTLDTADAHALYRRFGFVARTRIERAMIRPGTFLPENQ